MDCQKFEAMFDEIRDKVGALETKVDKLETENSEIKKELDELKSKDESFATQNQEIKSRINSLAVSFSFITKPLKYMYQG